MGIHNDWSELINSNAQNSSWLGAYFNAEKENYQKLISDYGTVYSGKLSELAGTFNMTPVIFAGFIDGINDSLKAPYDLEALEEDSEISLDFDAEKLYFNMLKAKADWLWGLPEWDSVLSEEKRREITKQYRISGRAVSEKTVGRNDPCPCGSGKKYKNCHGKRA